MSREPKPYGSLGLTGEMPRSKSDDQVKIEKILREEQAREAPRETYEQVLRRQAREGTTRQV